VSESGLIGSLFTVISSLIRSPFCSNAYARRINKCCRYGQVQLSRCIRTSCQIRATYVAEYRATSTENKILRALSNYPMPYLRTVVSTVKYSSTTANTSRALVVVGCCCCCRLHAAETLSFFARTVAREHVK
jgi:hypothetical protein